jgi:hypothetical protein
MVSPNSAKLSKDQLKAVLVLDANYQVRGPGRDVVSKIPTGHDRPGWPVPHDRVTKALKKLRLRSGRDRLYLSFLQCSGDVLSRDWKPEF